MATTLHGVHGRNVQLLVVVEYSNEWERALIHHLQMEERTARHWDLQWRQRIVIHSLAQVSIQGCTCAQRQITRTRSPMLWPGEFRVPRIIMISCEKKKKISKSSKIKNKVQGTMRTTKQYNGLVAQMIKVMSTVLHNVSVLNYQNL